MNDDTSTPVLEVGETQILCQMRTDLHEEFDIGLVEGFAELAGSVATVTKLAHRTLRITWA